MEYRFLVTKIYLCQMNQFDTLALENKKILVIFDLDETLIHSSRKELARKEDFMIGEFYVYKRPYLDLLLINLSEYFSFAIWSSGSKFYVDSVMEKLTPSGIKFEFNWSREKCTLRFDPEYHNHFYAKKLEKVEKLGFSKARVLIIEDIPKNVTFNYGNAVLVNQYIGNDDNELEALCNYLISLKDIMDVRPIEKRGWRQKLQGTSTQA